MDESRRFVRYILPGSVLGFLLGVAIFGYDPAWTRDAASKVGEGVASAVAAVLAGGALGYLASSVHHWRHWRSDDGILDHRPVLDQLRTAGLVELQFLHPPPEDFTARRNLSRKEAWILLSALWYSRVDGSDSMKGADAKAAGLTDMYHSLGAVQVGCEAAMLGLLAFATWRCLATPSYWAPGRLAFALAVTVFAYVVARSNARRTGELATKVIDQLLVTQLEKERLKATGSAIVRVPIRGRVHFWEADDTGA